jgi:predicted ferric reductase
VLPTSLLQSYHHSLNARSSDGESSNRIDIEKNGVSGTTKRAKVVEGDSTAGVTLLIRKSTGMTKFLAEQDNVLTFLDGPYSNNPTDLVLKCDRLVVIGGGIGISGIPPWLNAHPNAKLYWSVRKSAECLVEAVGHVLDGVAEKDVRVGQRLDIRGLIDREIEYGWKKIGVLACGPDGLCDDVRAAVVAAGRKGQLIELEVDAFSW